MGVMRVPLIHDPIQILINDAAVLGPVFRMSKSIPLSAAHNLAAGNLSSLCRCLPQANEEPPWPLYLRMRTASASGCLLILSARRYMI